MHIKRIFLAFFAVILPAIAGPPSIGDRYKVKGRDVVAVGEGVIEHSRSDCVQTSTCDLRMLIFRKMDFDVQTPGTPRDQPLILRGTEMFLGYLVNRPEDLERYLIVQFTRGCMWYTSLDSFGNEYTEFGIIRGFHGRRNIQHHFPSWVIDSNHADPAYSAGGDGEGRYFYLQTSDLVPLWIPERQGKIYGEEGATIPFGYITDEPGPAVYNPELKQARNMSLEFEVCLFKSTDVPLRASPEFTKEKALRCFSWDAKHVYDFKSGKFTGHDGIHPECMRPFRRNEEEYRDRVKQ